MCVAFQVSTLFNRHTRFNVLLPHIQLCTLEFNSEGHNDLNVNQWQISQYILSLCEVELNATGREQ